MKNIISFAVLFFLLLNLQAEERDSLRQARKVYSLNYKIDVPLTSVGTPLDSLTILVLDATTINGSGRSVTSQDAEFKATARSISNVTLGVSQMLPHVLMSYRF